MSSTPVRPWALHGALARWPALSVVAAVLAAASNGMAASASPTGPAGLAERDAAFTKSIQPFLENYCLDCHDSGTQKGKLDLESIAHLGSLEKHRETWEKVYGKVRHREMPPKDEVRPDEPEVRAITEWLRKEFDRQDAAAPIHVGRGAPRRLNRAEYNNTVRDFLGVNFMPADDFPQDDSGYGFDNNGDVLSLSPQLMEKYLKAAEKVARTAVYGTAPMKPTNYAHEPWYIDFDNSRTIPKPYDETGMSMPHALHVMHRFPVDADYDLTGFVRGFKPVGSDPCRVGFWIDGKFIQEMPVEIGPGGEMNGLGKTIRTRVAAGDHWLSVTLIKMYERLPAGYGGPNPNESQQRVGRSPNEHFINTLNVTGPFNQATGPTEESLRKLYRGQPPAGKVTAARAREIVTDLAGRAYRRPATKPEVDVLMRLVDAVQKDGDPFEEGLVLALTQMLISPHFLFRIERDPPANAKEPVAIAAHELASRLSYFLWSSMPDEELLRLADDKKLDQPAVLEAQVKRMLRDPKAIALVDNFAGQWLQFAAVDSHKVERKVFQHFTEYTKLSMQWETRKFIEHIVREDRSVLDIVEADYSFLNQRMAEYYGISGVEGVEFRKVALPPESHRRGVLTQASVLTMSSYANRTSPVIRGKYILENILNAAPPPPPPNVPTLEEKEIGTSKSMREMLEAHRSQPVCASCHVRMDPLGFGLENFDAVGRWRDTVGKVKIDASGALPDGRTFDGPLALTSILQAEREDFGECITEKLLIYALGRGLTPQDRPTVRRISAQLAAADYRFSSLVLSIVNSPQFRLRVAAAPKS
jgi:mono/diheme cytochrome c family protein